MRNMADPILDSANNMSPIPPTDDTLMKDVLDREVSPTSTDFEYMYLSDDSFNEHPNFDTEPEEEGSSAINDNIIDHGNRDCRLSIGEAIILTYPHPIKYEDDGEGNMFDDGLEDDQSEASGEASSNYEELTDSETTPVVLYMPDPDAEHWDMDGSPKSSDLDDVDDDYHQSDEDLEEDESVTVEEDPAVKLVLGGGAQGPESIIPNPAEIPQSPKKTFVQLLEQRYQLLYQKELLYKKGPCCWRKTFPEPDCDSIRWNILELKEMKNHIDEDIARCEELLVNAEKNKTAREDKVEAMFVYSSISMELYNAYEAFCESLDPQYGQREGFSITCNTDHDGSYVMYDPEFNAFKTCIEMSYTNCNFRSEAWTPAVCMSVHGPPLSSDIVEFWPIKSPIPNTGTEATWGEQYPELYDLAAFAVRTGSEAALEMLIALPERHSTFNGGWLFEYKFVNALQNHPVKAKRWRFDSAHKIDYPCTVEEKKKRVELMLRPECVQ